MDISKVINDIIVTYSTQIWIAFVSLVVTSLVLVSVKELVQDVIHFWSAKSSDIGYGQRIYWDSEIYIVKKIHFRYIEVYNEKKLVRIPIKLYFQKPIVFPQP